jgi:hypothetical protein
MKKQIIATLLVAAVLGLTACGEDEVKVIGNQTETTVQTTASTESTETAGTETAAPEAEQTVETASAGYVFEASFGGATASVSMDMDMSGVLAALGDPVTYFEAASCAFEGLDKIYTYDHFEIDTYPEGDKDLVSAVLLLDDLVTTPEGAYIGQTKAEIESIYGTDYETKGTAMVYTKDGAHLEFVLSGDAVQSISYQSSVLDE